MCVTTAEAQLKETIIGVWEIDHPSKGYRHVLAYQNSPLNLSTAGNCMLLHIPTSEALTPDCMLDTSQSPDFLKEMKKQLVPTPRSFSPKKEENYVLEMGIYHIALLNRIEDSTLEEVLQSIPKEKRPRIAPGFLNFYNDHFPGLPLVLCCFDSRERVHASPIMLHYTPLYPEYFFFPTLESHGTIPHFEEEVQFHQIIMAGTQQEVKGLPLFQYKKQDTELSSFFPKHGRGMQLDKYGPKGDVVIPRKQLLEEAQLKPLFSQGIS